MGGWDKVGRSENWRALEKLVEKKTGGREKLREY